MNIDFKDFTHKMERTLEHLNEQAAPTPRFWIV